MTVSFASYNSKIEVNSKKSGKFYKEHLEFFSASQGVWNMVDAILIIFTDHLLCAPNHTECSDQQKKDLRAFSKPKSVNTQTNFFTIWLWK